MKGITGPETYKALAEALPWELQTTLLSLRDCENDPAGREEMYRNMPVSVYFALEELCLATEWNETERDGLKLTSAGKHLADYCTC